MGDHRARGKKAEGKCSEGLSRKKANEPYSKGSWTRGDAGKEL